MADGLLARVAGALRGRAAPPPPTVRLEDVRRRLELLLAAVYGRGIPIVTAEPEPAPGWLRRAFRPVPPHLRPHGAGAASDAERVHLPAEMDAAGGEAAALARYRLLAIEQAERVARGTAALVPGERDRLERDLYLLAESAAVDGAIARTVPGVLPTLAAERAAALARRPPPDALTPAEREVEALVRRLLALDPGAPLPDLPADGTPDDSLAWARATAARLRASDARYRGVPAVDAWGTVRGAGDDASPGLKLAPRPSDNLRPAAPKGVKSSAARTAMPDEEGEPQQGAPPEREGGSDQAVAESTEGKEVVGPGSGGEAAEPVAAAEVARAEADAQDEEIVDDAPVAGTAPPPDARAGQEGIAYPEWDWRAGAYRRPGATVRMAAPVAGDGSWSAAVLAGHAALVRRMREQFERLRARRLRLTQQKDGDELDLAACVRALVDLRTGHSVDDRLYASVRPARRELSICLLVDISGSTIEPVNGTRIIDIEKTALLLTSEALDALGDRYAVLTFSGKGADHVRMRTIKDFDERNGEGVRQRIAALQPEGYTRMGAAVRHAAALLARQGTGHQLLLIISDGKPNDEDDYSGRYGVEDSRQAIAEARAQGVYPFCLTVDRKGSSYLARIFGRTGHVILIHPDQLPLALLGVVRQLLRS
ncbi:MAG: VWA domain-containing protein [Gemmatimonadetes bacterium]|nr:VWA domain-containing protein [Gemmatimonadota bacterium]